jgi:hypothetical protein
MRIDGHCNGAIERVDVAVVGCPRCGRLRVRLGLHRGVISS